MYAWTPLRLSGRPSTERAEPEPGPSLTPIAGAVLAFVREAVAAIAAEDEAAPLPLPLAAVRVLASFPARRAILASAVAKRLGADKSHVSRQLKLLVPAGLVDFAEGPPQRGAPLRITERGRMLLRQHKLRRITAVASLLRHLDPRERTRLRAMLERRR